MRFFAHLVATFFFSGKAPFAPGTAGSLASMVPLMLCAFLLPATAYAVILPVGILLFVATGIPAATFVSRELGRPDPGCVVIDEAAGQWITFLFIPAKLMTSVWWVPVAGFLLFRMLDIIKPFPVRQSERLPAGIGIVMDDVLAGLYACALLNLLVHFRLQ